VDDPSRITKSKAVGALFGLTPKKYQSGEKDFCQHSRYRQASDDLGLTVLGELRPIA
jgi:transposase